MESKKLPSKFLDPQVIPLSQLTHYIARGRIPGIVYRGAIAYPVLFQEKWFCCFEGNINAAKLMPFTNISFKTQIEALTVCRQALEGRWKQE